jgi:chemotaxis protein CheC
MMFLLKIESAETLAKIILSGMDVGDGDGLNDIQKSAIQEIGNIMTGSYLGSLAGLTNKVFIPSVPYLSIDMANAILSVPAIEFGKVADTALFIETAFGGDSYDINGYFLLVPDMPSFGIILDSLGVA